MSVEHLVFYLFMNIVSLCDATLVTSIGIAFFDHLPVPRFFLSVPYPTSFLF